MIITVGLASLAACDFSAPVDIDLPPYTPVMIVGGFVEAGALIEVRFAASRPAEAVDSASAGYLGPGVQSVLYDEAGRAIDTLRYAPPTQRSIYPRYLSSVVARAGAQYELRSQYAGLAPTRAVAHVPQPVSASITSVIVDTNPDGRPLRRVTLTWTDPPGPTTYAITAVDATGDFFPFTSSDPDLRDSYEGLGRPVPVDPEGGTTTPGFNGAAYLADATFSESRRTVSLTAFAPNQGQTGRVVLSVISDDMVRYLRALSIQQASVDNPFVEPIQAYSNVEGGLGAFVGYASFSQQF